MGELEMRITISDVLEKNATPEQKEAKIDIADFIAEDYVTSEEAPVPEDAPIAEDKPIVEDIPTVEVAPVMIEDPAPVVDIPKPSNTQLIVDEQKEILDARNMPPTEMLSRMGKENPEIFHLGDLFDTVTIDSS